MIRIPIRIADIVEIVLEVRPEVAEALRKDSPGGRKITRREAREIGETFIRAIVDRFGDQLVDAIDGEQG